MCESRIESYSTELATNIDFEIRDVFPGSPEVIYSLLGCNARISRSTLEERLLTTDVSPDNLTGLIELLMYFGVIGPIDTNGFAQYIYGHQYELRKLTAIHSQLAAGSDAVFEINPAFWAALDIDLL